MGLVTKWLEKIGLDYAIPAFRVAGINSPSALAQIQMSDYEKLGVTDWEDKKKLLYLVQRIQVLCVEASELEEKEKEKKRKQNQKHKMKKKQLAAEQITEQKQSRQRQSDYHDQSSPGSELDEDDESHNYDDETYYSDDNDSLSDSDGQMQSQAESQSEAPKTPSASIAAAEALAEWSAASATARNKNNNSNAIFLSPNSSVSSSLPSPPHYDEHDDDNYEDNEEGDALNFSDARRRLDLSSSGSKFQVQNLNNSDEYEISYSPSHLSKSMDKNRDDFLGSSHSNNTRRRQTIATTGTAGSTTAPGFTKRDISTAGSVISGIQPSPIVSRRSVSTKQTMHHPRHLKPLKTTKLSHQDEDTTSITSSTSSKLNGGNNNRKQQSKIPSPRKLKKSTTATSPSSLSSTTSSSKNSSTKTKSKSTTKLKPLSAPSSSTTAGSGTDTSTTRKFQSKIPNPSISIRNGKKTLSSIPSGRIAPMSPLVNMSSAQLDATITDNKGGAKKILEFVEDDYDDNLLDDNDGEICVLEDKDDFHDNDEEEENHTPTSSSRNSDDFTTTLSLSSKGERSKSHNSRSSQQKPSTTSGSSRRSNTTSSSRRISAPLPKISGNSNDILNSRFDDTLSVGSNSNSYSTNERKHSTSSNKPRTSTSGEQPQKNQRKSRLSLPATSFRRSSTSGSGTSTSRRSSSMSASRQLRRSSSELQQPSSSLSRQQQHHRSSTTSSPNRRKSIQLRQSMGSSVASIQSENNNYDDFLDTHSLPAPNNSSAVFVHGAPKDNSWASQVSQLREEMIEIHNQNNEEQSNAMFTSSLDNYNEEEEDDMRIRVVIRKRPMSKKEASANDVDVIQPLDCKGFGRLMVYQPKTRVDLTKEVETLKFSFDNVFGENSHNDEIYNKSVRNLIPGVFEGQWASVFAYGQTGSGKTFTMMGSSLTGMKGGNNKTTNHNKNLGLYYLAAQDVFQLASTQEYKHISIGVSFFEIYGGKLYDLISKRKPVKCLEDHRGKVCFPGLTEHPVSSPDQVLEVIESGAENRSTGSTSANADSSRSHAVLMLSLRKQTGRKNNVEHGRLTFIDLAGSERGADTAKACRTTRLEGAEINTSLLALKEVIRALATGDSMARIPFRGSKLTQVLKESFVGKYSRSVMVACVAPNMNNCEHTLNTLRYADRVKERDPETGGLSAKVMAACKVVKKAKKIMPLPSTANSMSKPERGEIGEKSARQQKIVSSRESQITEDEVDWSSEDEYHEETTTLESSGRVNEFSSPENEKLPSSRTSLTSRQRVQQSQKVVAKNEASKSLIMTHRKVMSGLLQSVKNEMSLVNQTDVNRERIEDYLDELQKVLSTNQSMLDSLGQSLLEYYASRGENFSTKPVLEEGSLSDSSFEDLRD